MGNEVVGERFARRVRLERQNRGWSQADLSELLNNAGIKAYPTTVAKIEAGTRDVRLQEATALAEIFEMTMDDLLSVSRPEPARVLGLVAEEMSNAASEVSEVTNRVINAYSRLRSFPDELPSRADGDMLGYVTRILLMSDPQDSAVRNLIDARDHLREVVHYATLSDELVHHRDTQQKLQEKLDSSKARREA